MVRQGALGPISRSIASGVESVHLCIQPRWFTDQRGARAEFCQQMLLCEPSASEAQAADV
jgi:hypothetical protein